MKSGAQKALLYGAGALLGGVGLITAGRLLFEWAADRAVSILTQDPYRENLLEVHSSLRRTGLQTIIETNLRAKHGRLLFRPLGSPKQFPNFDSLMFLGAQLDTLPTPFDRPVTLATTIGPAAARPLEVDIPVLVGGMGFGVGLSKAAKIAIARGASVAGTATNTGEGPFLPEERREARKLIVQYHRGSWMDESALRYADMVEIHIGQGASASGGGMLPPEKITRELKRAMRLAPGEKAFIRSTFPELERGRHLAILVDRARELSCGAPVVVKLAANHSIERDLSIAAEAGVDGVTLDGAQGGTAQSPAITEDDFGIPTLFALLRARKHLDRIDPERRISLLVSGGLYTPGDFLKCIALGADAVYVGSVILFALMAGQQHKATPLEPPVEVALYRGRYKRRLSVEEGARNVARYLKSVADEMAHAIRMLGKDHIADVGPGDLCALDREIAAIAGVEYAGKAPAAVTAPRALPDQRR